MKLLISKSNLVEGREIGAFEVGLALITAAPLGEEKVFAALTDRANAVVERNDNEAAHFVR